jgi:transaldolase/glucose-6-phosphate isomerase
MRIAVGADHAGVPLNERAIAELRRLGHEVVDLGTHDSSRPDDYPDYALAVAQELVSGRCERGLLICGSGVGVAVAANKVQGIRAALCHDTYSAHQGVEHDDMNVLCLGARVIGPELMLDIVRAFVNARFTGEERHRRRLQKIAALEHRFGEVPMSDNHLLELASFGQSVWLDQMRRSLLTSGELKRMVEEDGLSGVTSNPTIFEKAIAGSADYEDAVRDLAAQGASVDRIYEELVVSDIVAAADVLRPVYDKFDGLDGFVSLEVSPLLAHDTEATIAEAKSLFARLNRPNVMIKVPATPEGIPAIQNLIAAGINVNVTLIFAVNVYEQVAEAYIRGLERRVAEKKPIDRIASVASFFVSRIDTAVDRELEEIAKRRPEASALYGKAAIANAKLAYRSFKQIFEGERFATLKSKGGQVQRPLWASTSTKNPRYSDTTYVDSLIGSDTVDTITPQTLDAFRDHGHPAATLERDIEQASTVFKDLATLGIDFERITNELTREGVESFSKSFRQLLQVIEARSKEQIACVTARHTASLGTFSKAFSSALNDLASRNVVGRIWKKDPSVWSNASDHQSTIRNALGWLTVAETMLEHVSDLRAFAEQVRRDGFRFVVVLGMGGSSLCPEVLRHTFGHIGGWPELLVLDSTAPDTIRRINEQIDLEHTLFVVASKSGTTTEPEMFHRYYFDKAQQVTGGHAGKNFIAITDPGTQLEQQARRQGFRRVFINPADIGGRYSALSYFGMVPFALMGGDVEGLLHRALNAMHACAATIAVADNPGARIGATLGTLALAGRGKLTLVTPPPIDSLGLWIEQLIAESTGKEGKGIIPVAGEPLGDSSAYGNDRVFVYIHSGTDANAEIEAKLKALEAAGHPVLRHLLHDPLDLGEEFFLWEFATAVAGSVLKVDTFDQPNVQESKDNTKRILAEYTKTRTLGGQRAVAAGRGLSAFADAANARSVLESGSKSLDSILDAHLSRAREGDYVAITQFIAETDDNDKLLQQIRIAVRERTGAAVTTGYGPRFLHSTGQLHKGGPDTGVFLQITAADSEDVAIPGEPYTFGVLKQAQAQGDLESLARHNRRAIRVDLGDNAEQSLRNLLAIVQALPEHKETRIRKVG